MPADSPAPKPQGRYVPARRVGDLIVTAGMTPRIDGVMQYPGRVGDDVALADARAAAALAAGNALRALASVAPLAEVTMARMTVYVRAADDFQAHSQVADAASEVLTGELGERGECVRSAVGVASLPGGACVELELTAWHSARP